MPALSFRNHFARLRAMFLAQPPSARLIWSATIAVALADLALHIFSGIGDKEPAPIPAPQPDKAVVLTQAQRLAAGILVEAVRRKPLAEVVRAPGEVHVNDYVTSNIGSRVSATVVARHAKLGERVRRGQSLVTLYSPEVAEAQGAYVIADRLYQRLVKLEAYVSAQELEEASVKRDQARGRLQTYGLGAAEIDALAARGLTGRPPGQFDLMAGQNGIITADDFRSGAVVEPGRTLFEISDLSSIWVEAHVSPALLPRIAGIRAHVHSGGTRYEARIVQTHEQLDETTRTVGVRLQLDNAAGGLKPGEFVDVELFGAETPVIVVPTAAILRDAQGNWRVFVENARGGFESRGVQPLYSVDEETAIAGIAPGTRVVVGGAFFVNSEAEKSGFADEE